MAGSPDAVPEASPDAAAHPVSADEVRHVARLSRLTLDDGEVDAMAAQLGRVLGYIDQLSAVDVEGVEPMAHPLDLSNVLREDVPGEPLTADAALRNAPAADGGYFLVPKVLGGSS